MRTTLFPAGILCLLLALCPAVHAGIYTQATSGMYTPSAHGMYTGSHGMYAHTNTGSFAGNHSYGSMQGSTYSFHVAASNLTGEALNDCAPLAPQPTPAMSGTYSAPAHDPLTYRPRRVISDDDKDDPTLKPQDELGDPSLQPIGEVPVLLLILLATLVTYLRVRKLRMA